MIKVVDGLTHGASGPSLLEQCGIRRDGSLIQPNESMLPEPVILIVPRGEAGALLNTMRVTLSQGASRANRPREFAIALGPITGSYLQMGPVPIPADYVQLNFKPASKSMAIANALTQMETRTHDHR